jgi:hypothetical protein
VTRSLPFFLGAALGGGLLLYGAGIWPNGSAPPDGDTSGAPAVLVLLVDDRESVRGVRLAIDPARMVTQSDDGLALRGGRIVATSHDAVGQILATAGWTDRPIEIFDAASMRKSSGATESAATSRDATIASYARKPTLNYIEALSLLSAMDGG